MDKPKPHTLAVVIALWVFLGTATVFELLFVEDYEWLSIVTAWLGGMVTYRLIDIYCDARDSHL